MEEVLVPIALFAIIPVIVWSVSHYRYKSHQRASSVMEKMVEKGEPLTPELIQSLGIRPRQPHGDLRTGIILISIGIAMLLLGGVVDDHEAANFFGGLAMFPLLVGAAFILCWFLIGRKAVQD